MLFLRHSVFIRCQQYTTTGNIEAVLLINIGLIMNLIIKLLELQGPMIPFSSSYRGTMCPFGPSLMFTFRLLGCFIALLQCGNVITNGGSIVVW